MGCPTLERRDFLKSAAAAGAAVAVGTTVNATGAEAALSRGALPMPEGALGMLYDATQCIGCQACVAACKDANDMPAVQPAEMASWNGGTWDTPIDLSADTLNVIKAYRDGTGETKDAETDGYSFTKKHCMHCVDPSCVSVCPVTANYKDEVTGIVKHDPEACIGCRYCVLSCPFAVPKYEYDDAFGRIRKCELCSHLQAQGGIPACCDVCPTGASLFGPVEELRQEAEARLAKQPGETHTFPRGDIRDDRPSHDAGVKQYVESSYYGKDILGGTQVNHLAGVPFDKLGLPVDKPDEGYPALSEGIQHTVYSGMIAPAAVLGGLVVAAYKNRTGHEKDDD